MTAQRRLPVAVLAVALLFGACGSRTPSASPRTTSSTGPGAAGETAAPGTFGLGIEYGVPGLAAAYRPTGITRIKPALEFGVWGNLEPTRGRRDFRPLDTLVHEYQAAGFVDVQLIVSAESPWASRKASTDPMPRDEYLADYGSFVAALVERYDGDGRDDAPGLVNPVHEYGLERELSKFWGSSAADYVRLLEIAAPAIRAADPSARILVAAVLAVDVFDGSPAATTIEQRWRTNEPFRKSRMDVVSILGACRLYDDVDMHSLGDATEIAPTIAWIRARLSEAGCPDRPVWVGDAFPASTLVAYNNRPFYPAAGGQQGAITALLGAAVDAGDPAHAVGLAWARAQVARGLVRKAVLAAAAGAAGINLGNLEDWTTGLVPADRLFAAGAGTSVVSGHVDTTISNNRPGGPLPYAGDGFSRARSAGAARPSFTALTQVAGALRGATAVAREPAADPGAWLFLLGGRAPATWIGWVDDGTQDLPGAGPATREVRLPVAGAGVTITRIAADGTAAAAPTSLGAVGGIALVTLDRTPVIITAR